MAKAPGRKLCDEGGSRDYIPPIPSLPWSRRTYPGSQAASLGSFCGAGQAAIEFAAHISQGL